MAIYRETKDRYDRSTKTNIVLIVPDDLSNGNPECCRGIQNYSEVTGGQGEAATQS